MFYLLQGNAEEIFTMFGLQFLLQVTNNLAADVQMDLSRTRWLGSADDIQTLLREWSSKKDSVYSQGDVNAENCILTLGSVPLITEEELKNIADLDRLTTRFTFGFLSDDKAPSGMTLIYRTDNPGRWLLAFTRNAHLAPKDRQVLLLSSENIARKSEGATKQTTVNLFSDPAVSEQLAKQTNSSLIVNLIAHLIDTTTGTVKPQISRLSLLLQFVGQDLVPKHPSFDPRQFDLQAFVTAKDEVLDWIEHQNDHPYLSKLDLVSFHQLLVIKAKFTLPQFIGFISGELDQLHRLLVIQSKLPMAEVIEFIKALDRPKVLKNLMPYLAMSIEKNAPTIESLSELLKKPIQLAEEAIKRQLDEIVTKDSLGKILTSNISLLELLACMGEARTPEILKEIIPYLVNIIEKKAYTPNEINDLLKKPKWFLKKIIKQEFKEIIAKHDLSISDDLSIQDLYRLLSSLRVIRQSKLEDKDINLRQLYQLLTSKEKNGVKSRLFIDKFDGLTASNQSSYAIKAVYFSLMKSIGEQGQLLKELGHDPIGAGLVQIIQEQVHTVKILQDLDLPEDVYEFAAQDNQKAHQFRQIILKTEAENNIIHQRLAKTKDTIEQNQQWKNASCKFRKSLYVIAYKGLVQGERNIEHQIEMAEKEILDIVDPEIQSEIKIGLLILANVVIALLSLFIANLVKYHYTDTFLFFTRTKSGEEIRALDKEVLSLITHPEPHGH